MHATNLQNIYNPSKYNLELLYSGDGQEDGGGSND